MILMVAHGSYSGRYTVDTNVLESCSDATKPHIETERATDPRNHEKTKIEKLPKRIIKEDTWLNF